MQRVFGVGLVALGVLLGVASLLQYTLELVALPQVALSLGVAAVLALASGTSLWILARQSAKSSPIAESPAMTMLVGGRTHTRGVPYVLPRDLEEMNRLDFQHFVLRQAFKGNFLAPVASPREILDVGTGTGRWAREVADVFPTANVVGLDINPPPIDERSAAGGTELRPANYTFVPGNILEGLPFADGSFDFVHMRLLVLAMPHDRWPFVVNELIRVTRPGGWVESVEVIEDQRGGTAVDQIMGWVSAMLQRRGIDISDGSRVGALLQAHGLINVSTRRVEVPIGAHGGRVGRLMAADILNGMQALRGPMEQMGVTTSAEFDQVFAEARQAMNSPRVRCVAPFYLSYGQRPI